MKDLKYYIIVMTSLLTVYLVAEYNKPKSINWNETLTNTDKIPYGTFILYHQLHDIFPGAKIMAYNEPVYNVITDYGIEHAAYLIICRDINITEDDYDKLTGFIKKGNDVFIASESFGGYMAKNLKLETAPQLQFDDAVHGFKFVNKTLDTGKVYNVGKNMSYYYFNSLDTTKAVVLGKDTYHHIDYIRYNFGQGALYLHTNPLLFTNYSLLNNDGAAYAAMALSNLHNSEKLLWDNYYLITKEDEQSVMRVFLKNPALKWAFYLSVFSLLIFVLYEMKRRQRVIPVIEPLQNSTLDFVNVVGQVYYEQRDNRNIAQKKATYFLEFIRTRYHLKTAILNDEFEETLAHKTGVEPAFIHQLVQQLIFVRGGVYVNDADLIELNKNIEQFYLQSR